MGEAGGRASATPLLGGATEPTIFELSSAGRRASSLPDLDVPRRNLDLPEQRKGLVSLPEVSEHDLVMHGTRLAHRNFAVDLGAYPLGSCTMKYNPKVCDFAAEHPGFRDLHPATPAEMTQGALGVIVEAERMLCEITGMSRASFQPPAGASGELTGLLIMRAYHRDNGNDRDEVLIPDSAHGTNPASVSLSGLKTVIVPSDDKGMVDLEALRGLAGPRTVGLMLTNPNTLGLFEENIIDMAAAVHEAGGLLYYDGANLNAILGVARPGDMGFDIVHSNLHKTFATPHGGGGPGAGPVAVTAELADYLPGPIPRVESGGSIEWATPSKSIGRMHAYHGNFLVVLRALTYMKLLGRDGLRSTANRAVLNARYLASLISDSFPTAYESPCMHEFVATSHAIKKETGVRAFDIAKALPDHGFHAPTMYFPLIVDEALMIEPTETQSRETVEALADALNSIGKESFDDPKSVMAAPSTTPIGRPDEAEAARNLDINWAAR